MDTILDGKIGQISVIYLHCIQITSGYLYILGVQDMIDKNNCVENSFNINFHLFLMRVLKILSFLFPNELPKENWVSIRFHKEYFASKEI